MNAPTAPDPGSNRLDTLITSARNAHGSTLCVVLNPLNNLPLIPHNPCRDGCEYQRGRITVLDRAGLEARTCECYAVVKKEYERLLPDRTAT